MGCLCSYCGGDSDHSVRWGLFEGSADMGRRANDPDNGSGGRLTRAWRWLQSSGFAEDDALYGPPRPELSKERFVLAVLTQAVFWRTNR